MAMPSKLFSSLAGNFLLSQPGITVTMLFQSRSQRSASVVPARRPSETEDNMFRLQWVFFIALMALVGVSTGTAGAQTLYGVTYSPPQLITINTATGAGTLVGNLNPAIIADGIAFRGAKLYVMDGTSQNIYEINPATGATLATINIGAPPGSFGEGGMAFRSDGIGFLIGFSPTPLIRFDITVPSSTVIAPVVPAFILDEMAFNASDVLYGISQSTGLPFNDVSTQLYTINQATGAMTLVGPSGINNQ